MKPLNRQQFILLPQRCRCVSVVTRSQALIRKMRRVIRLWLDSGVAESVAISGKLGNAAHEVTIRVAGLLVVRVVDTDDHADVPVKVAAVGGLLQWVTSRIEQPQAR